MQAYRGNYVFDSYFRLRAGIGVLGILLPLILGIGSWIGNGGLVLDSVSDYFNSVLNPFFVGILFILALFLYTYRGSGTGRENWVTNAASVSALLTALLPSRRLLEGAPEVNAFVRPTLSFAYSLGWEDAWVGGLHLAAAASLFGLFAYLSFFVFPEPESLRADLAAEDLPGAPRRWVPPARVFRSLGVFIAGMVGLCIADEVWRRWFGASRPDFPFLFYYESAALLAFGASWLLKAWYLYSHRRLLWAYRRGRQSSYQEEGK